MKATDMIRVITCLLLILAAFIAGSCESSSDSTGDLPETLAELPATAEILFTSNQDTGAPRWEIYAMDSQGGNIIRITDSDENHFIMGIDPSKRYLAATRGTDTKKRLWLLDLLAGEETALTDAENHAEGRSFSPDGEWIVFWMTLAGETTSDIYKIRRDGTELTNLTNTPLALEFDPAWSSGGDEIAFCYNDLTPNRFVLKAMDPNGENIREIYDPDDAVGTAIFPAGVYDPDWSPDDEWILIEKPIQFTGDGENGHAGVWRILKVRADGNEVMDLTGGGEFAECALYLPSFSPDGDSIAFSSRCGPEDPSQTFININTMDSNGGSIHKLTDTPLWEQFAVWIR